MRFCGVRNSANCYCRTPRWTVKLISTNSIRGKFLSSFPNWFEDHVSMMLKMFAMRNRNVIASKYYFSLSSSPSQCYRPPISVQALRPSPWIVPVAANDVPYSCNVLSNQPFSIVLRSHRRNNHWNPRNNLLLLFILFAWFLQFTSNYLICFICNIKKSKAIS